MIERLRRALEEASENDQHRLAPLGQFVAISRGEELGRGAGEIRRFDGDARAMEQGTGAMASIAPTLDSERHEGRGDACHRPGNPDNTLRPGDSSEHRGCEHQDWWPVLLGGVDIHPYYTPAAGAWIARAHVKKPLARYLAPKLLVVKSTDRLQAALDRQGHIALQTLYLLHLKNTGDADDLYYFLALLNSRLLREYVYVLHTAYKWVQPQIEQHVLARLPVPLATPARKREIIERAKQLARACGAAGAVVEWDDTLQHAYEEQERAISALYNAALRNRPLNP